jgi:hypothetical protein
MSDDKTLVDLSTDHENAEAELLAAAQEYDERRQALKDEFQPRIQKLTKAAADAQKRMLNRTVLESLADRPDKWAVLESLQKQGWEGGPTKTEIKAVLGSEDG